MSLDTIPDWQIERFRLDELPAEEQIIVAHALAESASLRERLAAFDRGDERILAVRPPREVAERIRAQLEAQARPWTPHRARVALAFAASAVLVGLWTLLPGSRTSPPTGAAASDVTRVKGLQPQLLLFKKAPQGPEPLRDGAAVRARDVIQVSYVAAASRYGVVVSIDGRGGVTCHLPSTGSRAAELEIRGPTTLASAFELDDAPAFERFFFVTSPKPFPVSVVTEAAARFASHGAGDRLRLPPALEQSTVLLRKGGPR